MAMLLAQGGMVPPKQWCHDSSLKNVKNYTVAFYLRKSGTKVPPEWNDS